MDIELKNPEIEFALEAITLGAELAYRIRSEPPVKIIAKEDSSPVTLADMGIQAIVGALLSHYFPKVPLVAEETSIFFQTPDGRKELEKVAGYLYAMFPQANPDRVCGWIDRGMGETAPSFWTLDPIDGTKGFLRGGQYAIALAKIRDGKVVLAALGCPELELPGAYGLTQGVGVLAQPGRGCWAASLDDLEDEKKWVRLKVSPCVKISEARVLDSFEMGHKDTAQNQRIRELLGIFSGPLTMDSMAKHVVLASGGAEIFFRALSKEKAAYRDKIWDVAAGALAIEEAGGRVTDLQGQAMDFGVGRTLAKNPGFLATNGFFHEKLLEVLKEFDG